MVICFAVRIFLPDCLPLRKWLKFCCRISSMVRSCSKTLSCVNLSCVDNHITAFASFSIDCFSSCCCVDSHITAFVSFSIDLGTNKIYLIERSYTTNPRSGRTDERPAVVISGSSRLLSQIRGSCGCHGRSGHHRRSCQ